MGCLRHKWLRTIDHVARANSTILCPIVHYSLLLPHVLVHLHYSVIVDDTDTGKGRFLSPWSDTDHLTVDREIHSWSKDDGSDLRNAVVAMLLTLCVRCCETLHLQSSCATPAATRHSCDRSKTPRYQYSTMWRPGAQLLEGMRTLRSQRLRQVSHCRVESFVSCEGEKVMSRCARSQVSAATATTQASQFLAKSIKREMARTFCSASQLEDGA